MITKDEALTRAMSSTQPEVSLALDGWYLISFAALARHEMRIGEVAQLKRKLEQERAVTPGGLIGRDGKTDNPPGGDDE